VPASTENHKGRGRRRWLWAAMVIILPSVFLRTCVMSTFAIQSASMEPTLQTGDVLVVLLDGVDPWVVDRWDVGLFGRGIDREVPEGIDAVIKRVVGLPGEFIEIRGGDIYIGTSKERMSLERKPDDLVRSLLVPVHSSEGLDAAWGGGQGIPVPGGTRLETTNGESWSYFSHDIRDGQGTDIGATLVGDTALEVVLGEVRGTLLLRLREGADTFHARLGSGEAVLWHNLGEGGVVASRDGFVGLTPGQEVLFWNVDNGVRLLVDGDLILSYDYERNEAQTPGAPLHNLPGLGVEGGSLEVRQLTILHDIHYASQGQYGTQSGSGFTPAQVLQNELFLLGDYSRKSRDSRYFGAVKMSDLLGRPWAIYAPWERAAWLSRAGVSR
jgi:signal peptidase I